MRLDVISVTSYRCDGRHDCPAGDRPTENKRTENAESENAVSDNTVGNASPENAERECNVYSNENECDIVVAE